jgi:hypothetical protein
MDNYQNSTWYSSLEIIELATNKVLEMKTSDKLKEETNIIEFRSDSKIVVRLFSLSKYFTCIFFYFKFIYILNLLYRRWYIHLRKM